MMKRALLILSGGQGVMGEKGEEGREGRLGKAKGGQE